MAMIVALEGVISIDQTYGPLCLFLSCLIHLKRKTFKGFHSAKLTKTMLVFFIIVQVFFFSPK